MKQTAEQRFLAMVKLGEGDECHLWTGYRDRKGYGQFWDGTYRPWPGGRRPRKGNYVGAHRWAYAHFVGPIPPGAWVCHRCDNPPCVRWDGHLFADTSRANIADRHAKGRDARNHGERAGGAKLTADQVRTIRATWASGQLSQRRIAALFDVSFQTISKICRGERWSHL